jgi:hypothetical protein
VSEFKAKAPFPVQDKTTLREFVRTIIEVRGNPMHDRRPDVVTVNTWRAARAGEVLRRYAEFTNSGDEPFDVVLSDLLADLRHLADVLVMTEEADFDGANEAAQRRYVEEIGGEL